MVATLEKSEKTREIQQHSLDATSKRQKLEDGKKQTSPKVQNLVEEDASKSGVVEEISEEKEKEMVEEDDYYKEIQKKQEEKKKLKEEMMKEIQRQKTMLPPEITGEDDDSFTGKRPITQKMEKNISLRKKTKKQIKNPRVKHKLKYKKALVRRAGQVQKMRDKSEKYHGEKTGIKTNVIKSTPL